MKTNFFLNILCCFEGSAIAQSSPPLKDRMRLSSSGNVGAVRNLNLAKTGFESGLNAESIKVETIELSG